MNNILKNFNCCPDSNYGDEFVYVDVESNNSRIVKSEDEERIKDLYGDEAWEALPKELLGTDRVLECSTYTFQDYCHECDDAHDAVAVMREYVNLALRFAPTEWREIHAADWIESEYSAEDWDEDVANDRTPYAEVATTCIRNRPGVAKGFDGHWMDDWADSLQGAPWTWKLEGFESETPYKDIVQDIKDDNDRTLSDAIKPHEFREVKRRLANFRRYPEDWAKTIQKLYGDEVWQKLLERAELKIDEDGDLIDKDGDYVDMRDLARNRTTILDEVEEKITACKKYYDQKFDGYVTRLTVELTLGEEKIATATVLNGSKLLEGFNND